MDLIKTRDSMNKNTITFGEILIIIVMKNIYQFLLIIGHLFLDDAIIKEDCYNKIF